jgi:hypothetical protein
MAQINETRPGQRGTTKGRFTAVGNAGYTLAGGYFEPTTEGGPSAVGSAGFAGAHPSPATKLLQHRNDRSGVLFFELNPDFRFSVQEFVQARLHLIMAPPNASRG